MSLINTSALVLQVEQIIAKNAAATELIKQTVTKGTTKVTILSKIASSVKGTTPITLLIGVAAGELTGRICETLNLDDTHKYIWQAIACAGVGGGVAYWTHDLVGGTGVVVEVIMYATGNSPAEVIIIPTIKTLTKPIFLTALATALTTAVLPQSAVALFTQMIRTTPTDPQGTTQ